MAWNAVAPRIKPHSGSTPNLRDLRPLEHQLSLELYLDPRKIHQADLEITCTSNCYCSMWCCGEQCSCCCRYDANGDGKIDSSELRSLCADAGKNLTEEETKAALQAIDENENGVIEFNEFVGFWVNPSKYVAELKSISEAAKEKSEKGSAETAEKEQVSSVSSK